MFVDVSNVSGGHTSPEDIRELQEAVSRADGKRIMSLRLQHNGLTTLTVSTKLLTAVQHVTSLTASHNSLRTLQGLESFPFVESLDLSYNALRVLDAHSASILRRLKYLRRFDLSHNELCLLDLEMFPHANNARNDGLECDDAFVSTTLDELAVLNLSHNQLNDVPDIRCMPLLEELYIDHNRIEYVTDLDSRLPLVALRSFSITYNSLRVLHDLTPLTVLAETLKVLHIKGNPCVSAPTAASKGSAVRLLLLWLLPQLETIDDVAPSQEERQAVGRMFRQSGELSHEAIGYLNVHNNMQLEAYLQKFVLTPSQNVGLMSGAVPSQQQQPIPHIQMQTQTPKEQKIAVPITEAESRSLSLSLGGMTSRLPTAFNAQNAAIYSNKNTSRNSSSNAPAVGAGGDNVVRTQPPEVVLQMMQKKLKQLSNVMEVLWKESMTRRVFATIVLQKHVRGFLARQHLPLSIQRSCASIRNNLRCSLRGLMWVHQLQNTAKPNETQRSNRNNINNTNSNGSSSGRGAVDNNYSALEQAALVKEVQNIEVQMRSMWIVVDGCRRMMNQRRHAAAITIQKYYRGYVDRKQWRHLKKLYDDFVLSLRPNVVTIQRVCRGYLAREKLTERCRESRGLRSLRAELAELRRTVDEMRTFVEQIQRRQRLDRYSDPEKAMDDIISRHSASRVANTKE